MNKLSSLIATMAIALCGIGFATSAEAQSATIRIDNYANPAGSILNTSTTNTITVKARFCGQASYVTIGSRVLNTISGQHDFTWTPTAGRAAKDVTDVRVQINGDDWFWVDQVEVLSGSTVVLTRGVDNTQGWCISTDPTDGDSSICYNDHSVQLEDIDMPPTYCDVGVIIIP